tara:strand:+ start:7187 stop:7963 length:777 start_codon:yes stop_codon:yes gene_type:complete
MSVTELGNQLGNPLAKPSTSGGGGGFELKQVNEQVDNWQYHLQNGIVSVTIPTGTGWDDYMVIGKVYYDRGEVSSYDAGLQQLHTTPAEEVGFMMPRDRSMPEGSSSFDCQGIGQIWHTAIGNYSYRKQGQTFFYSGRSIYLRNHAYEGINPIYGRMVWRSYDNDIEYASRNNEFGTTSKSWNDVFGSKFNRGYLFKGVQHYDTGSVSTWFEKGVPKTLNSLYSMNSSQTFNLIFDGDAFVLSQNYSNFQSFAFNLIE